uniref:BTB domain-containing protein n=1 Tax=Panagrellus redivivus TaxID=6233 RepID=A0A7E4UL06_PANRE
MSHPEDALGLNAVDNGDDDGASSPGGEVDKKNPNELELPLFMSLRKLNLFRDDESPTSTSATPSMNAAPKVPPIHGSVTGPEFLLACGGGGQSRGYTDKKTKGTIKLIISNLGGLKTKVTSSFHNIANLPWRLAAKTETSKRTNGIRFFSIYIDCNPESESTLWSCEAVVEFALIAQRPCGSDFTRTFTNTFSYNSNNWGFPSFIEFSDITNADKGFIRNDKVVVEAHIVVNNVVGVSRTSVFDFQSNNCPMSDGILLVEGAPLYISKQYLALHSPVFEAMFYSSFIERDKREIPIEDVIYEEFLELLHVLYPSRKPVTAENVEYLLELADKYQIQFVMDQCESFLQNTEDVNIVTKLVWADQYTLSRLQHVCIRALHQPCDVKALRATEEFRKLSDSTRSALLEKLLKILE